MWCQCVCCIYKWGHCVIAQCDGAIWFSCKFIFGYLSQCNLSGGSESLQLLDLAFGRCHQRCSDGVGTCVKLEGIQGAPNWILKFRFYTNYYWEFTDKIGVQIVCPWVQNILATPPDTIHCFHVLRAYNSFHNLQDSHSFWLAAFRHPPFCIYHYFCILLVRAFAIISIKC